MTTPTQALQVPLAAGQTLYLHARRGAVLHVHDGALTLVEPAIWLCGYAMRPQRSLRAGCVYVLPEAGWISLTAERNTVFSARGLQERTGWGWPGAVLRWLGRRLPLAAPARRCSDL